MEANKTWKLQILLFGQQIKKLINYIQNCRLPLPVTMFKRDIPVAIGPVHQSAKMLRQTEHSIKDVSVDINKKGRL